MALSMALAVPGCAMAEESTETEAVSEAAETEAVSEAAESETEAETDVKGEGVMTHDEYLAAETDAEVVVETYVQAKQ